MGYKSKINAVHSCKYHLIWRPKYRRKVLAGPIADRLKELILQNAVTFDSEVIELEVMPGEGKPETFDFLGFTHLCGKTRKGKFALLRKTMRKKMQRKLMELRKELRKRMHAPISEVGKWLKSVLAGHYRYYGVPSNSPSMSSFRYHLLRYWKWIIRRRSQRQRTTWERMKLIAARWLPLPHIYHPYPSELLRVTT